MSYYNNKSTSIVLKTNKLISRLNAGDVSIFEDLIEIPPVNRNYAKSRILKSILINKNEKFLFLYIDKYGVPDISEFISSNWLGGLKSLIESKIIKDDNYYYQADKYFLEAFKNKKYDFVLELAPRVNNIRILLGLKPQELNLKKVDLRNSTIVLAKKDHQDELALTLATTAYNSILKVNPDSILCKTLRNMIDVLTRITC